MIFLFAFISIGIIGFALAQDNHYGPNGNDSDDDEGVFCTQEAKLCPDGKNYVSRDSNNDCEFDECPEIDDGLVGSSCGTVTPGMNNECCLNKGYDLWDEEESACIKLNKENGKGNHEENREHEMECENWNCTKWSTCMNSTDMKVRQCTRTSFNCTTDDERPKLTKTCHEKDELKLYNKTHDCPENCICTGSTIKCTFENGTRVMTIYAGKSGNVIVQIQDANMSTNVTLYKDEEGKVYGIFEGNKTHEIMMPNEAKEKLQNHTRARLYNESMNLTEDGYYQIDGKKKSRLFFIIPVKEHVEAEVNAETGEAVKIRNPWWGFLARDVKDKSED